MSALSSLTSNKTPTSKVLENQLFYLISTIVVKQTYRHHLLSLNAASLLFISWVAKKGTFFSFLHTFQTSIQSVSENAISICEEPRTIFSTNCQREYQWQWHFSTKHFLNFLFFAKYENCLKSVPNFNIYSVEFALLTFGKYSLHDNIFCKCGTSKFANIKCRTFF